MAAWSVVSRTEYGRAAGARFENLFCLMYRADLVLEEDLDFNETAADLEECVRDFCIRKCLRESLVPDLDQPWPLNLRFCFFFELVGGMPLLEAAFRDAGVEVSSSDGTKDAARSSGR